ncbi:universal stress protein [Marinospirillum insulare]|uniref:Universal stress protein A n=1 Tax=Marinospirillum insulare TaxID=217169 RepID=A0ABQ6A0Q2_9GAMM|nr:universal stress protein [Marinospirillum insulare]GLR63828.1 universal stress protein A [Marinospirillum insulare]
MNKIITCIDGSALSDDVCHAGVWAANKLDKTLLLLNAIEKAASPSTKNLSGAIGLGARTALLLEMASLDEQRSKVALTLGKEILEEAKDLAASKGCQSIEKTLRHSGIVEAIRDLEADARLVVIGRLGEGNEQSFKMLGSHIEQVIRQVHTPVLIVNKDFVEPKSFMLAYDGRETADKAVQRILEGGLLDNLTCHLVTVKNKQPKLQEKFEQTKALLIEKGFEVKASFLEGNIFNALEAYKQKEAVDLLVMGAFSHSKLATVFLGSNTLKMVETTQLPLLILH